MNILSKIRTAVKVAKQDGVYGILWVLISKYQLPILKNKKLERKVALLTEVRFWDDYFRTNGLLWPKSYVNRLDPNLPIQSRVVALLPPSEKIQILDVGAGPLTYLGKICKGRDISIAVVDPLADEYDRLLGKYKITPLVRTYKLAAEELTNVYSQNTFDLVFARNSIDHCSNPEIAILQMINVAKSNCFVLLEHKVNTKKYKELCEITSEIVEEKDGDWIITRIFKCST